MFFGNPASRSLLSIEAMANIVFRCFRPTGFQSSFSLPSFLPSSTVRSRFARSLAHSLLRFERGEVYPIVVNILSHEHDVTGAIKSLQYVRISFGRARPIPLKVHGDGRFESQLMIEADRSIRTPPSLSSVSAPTFHLGPRQIGISARLNVQFRTAFMAL